MVGEQAGGGDDGSDGAGADGEPRSADQRLVAFALVAGGVAHDLNNMLAVTLALCESLLRDASLGEATRDGVGAILESSQRARDLVRRLLLLGRGAPPAPSAVDVNMVVAEVADLLARVLGEDVCVELALCPGLPPVLVDPTQLERCVMNLMLNARGAMRDGGTIRVCTERKDGATSFDGTRLAGPCVVLSVSDTGTGMTPEVRARLFEPFFSTKPGGTGLGLASVHRWLASCGGVVDVESEPGRGSTFTLALGLTA